MVSPLPKNSFFIFFFFLLVPSLVLALNPTKPCKRIVLYYHDILFNGTDAANATSAMITNGSRALGSEFGMMVVFDDPLTENEHLRSPEATRAQGFYFYDQKKTYSAWFAYTVIFNTSQYKGTLNIMGADPLPEKTRDLSVVGGTGDFFMARGIATFKTDEVETRLTICENGEYIQDWLQVSNLFSFKLLFDGRLDH